MPTYLGLVGDERDIVELARIMGGSTDRSRVAVTRPGRETELRKELGLPGKTGDARDRLAVEREGP